MLKLVIDRPRWIRGDTHLSSSLLTIVRQYDKDECSYVSEEKSKVWGRCCLGFLAAKCEVPDELMMNVSYPEPCWVSRWPSLPNKLFTPMTEAEVRHWKDLIGIPYFFGESYAPNPLVVGDRLTWLWLFTLLNDHNRETFSKEERELLLKKAFKKIGVEVSFQGTGAPSFKE